MSIQRNKDGSVTIKSNDGVTTIGKIIKVSVDKQEERFQQWVDDCAKLVTACAHTLKETEQYFLNHCDALPLKSDDKRMKSFQCNVIMNYCKDKLEHQPSQFSFDMTDEEIEKWHKEDNAMHEEAMNSSPEHFGLNIRGYYLPHTERNSVFYEQAYIKIQKFMERNNSAPEQIKMQDICLFFEETTGHWQCSGGGDSLMNQLLVFRGISQDDIEKRTPRFLQYITTLRDMGNLSSIIEEG
ncbi:hypothetical protein [Desnuesiella massiliensis]|uniref:hypothetical protein n=1 Tax=Desnuesiella massiliensis TaxID=1650662 RepID=UPI0006E182CA|nr:hypothetical protein [Desnuesiella massiliensis]